MSQPVRYVAHGTVGQQKLVSTQFRSGVEQFTPYDLRRSAAARVRSELGKEAAKLLLGPVSADTTEIYLLDEVKETRCSLPDCSD